MWKMIRTYREKDLEMIMDIWLQANLEAHDFIPSAYWKNNFASVKELIPQAQVFVFEEKTEILGFIGLTDDYIAGIFVKRGARSRGIGRQLLDYAKAKYPCLSLDVYAENTSAVRFYEREGFHIIKEHIDEENHLHEYTMRFQNQTVQGAADADDNLRCL